MAPNAGTLASSPALAGEADGGERGGEPAAEGRVEGLGAGGGVRAFGAGPEPDDQRVGVERDWIC